MTIHKTWLAVVVVLAGCTLARADWPQFLGPTRDNKSVETGLDRTLGGGKPEVLWTVDMGEGFGGPAIRDGKVFVLDRRRNAQDILLCLDLKTGKELWRCVYAAPGKKLSHNGSRSVPAVDDKYVFAVGAFGQLYCISRTTHKPVWKKHLLKDFGGKLPLWGISQSPLLYKDWVVLCPLGRDAGVVAFDRDTGKIAWKSPPLGPKGCVSGLGSYASVMPGKLGGVEQFLVVNNDRVCGISVEDGKVLWTYKDWWCKIHIPGPTQVDDGRVFITGGYGSGSAMLRVTKSGGGFKVAADYKLAADVCGSQTHQVLVIDGHMYMNSNSNEHSDGMMCVTLDGKVKWKTGRKPNFQRGNLIYADGLIYNLDGKTGILHLIKPDPSGYKELARAKLLGGREIWAPMALSGDKLVIRDQSQMKCIAVKAK